MFHYEQYRDCDMHRIRLFVERFPLALITTRKASEWHCSHIPLFWDRDAENELFGHVDIRNPQFSGGDEFDAHIAFCGPDAYIPPEAYRNRQLPTWNYLAVHANATVSLDRDPARNLALLRETALRLQGEPSSFRVLATDERIPRWIGSISGLRIKINQMEGRFKLSQDKPREDVKAAAAYFFERSRKQLSTELLDRLAGIDA